MNKEKHTGSLPSQLSKMDLKALLHMSSDHLEDAIFPLISKAKCSGVPAKKVLLIFQLSPGEMPLQNLGYSSYATFGVKYAGAIGGFDETQNKGFGGSGGGPAMNLVSALGCLWNIIRLYSSRLFVCGFMQVQSTHGSTVQSFSSGLPRLCVLAYVKTACYPLSYLSTRQANKPNV